MGRIKSPEKEQKGGARDSGKQAEKEENKKSQDRESAGRLHSLNRTRAVCLGSVLPVLWETSFHVKMSVVDQKSAAVEVIEEFSSCKVVPLPTWGVQE